MRSVIVVIVSVIILAGAYVYAFGMPQPVAQLIGQQPRAETAVAAAGQRGAGPAGDGIGAGAPGAPPGGVRGAAGQGASRGEDRSAGAGSSAGGAPPGGAGGGRGNRVTVVRTATLEEQPYSLVLRTIGSGRSLLDVNVTSSQAGEIVELALEANKVVAKGDVLMRLDDETERLSLQVAEAARDKTLDTATRYRTLRRSGDLSVTQAELADAESDLRLAEANVGLARHDLNQRTFLAPIGGRLGLGDLQVGDRVSVGDAIVTIDDSSTLVAEFEVPELSMGLLKVGREVLLGTPTYRGRVFRGQITAYDSRLDSVTRSATVQAQVDNAEGLLLSGMTFAVRLIDETDPLPMVPATAITWDRDGAGVWMVDGDQASRRSVAIRYRSGDSVWVDTDVAPGSSIVVEGAAKLRAGARVRAVAEGADS